MGHTPGPWVNSSGYITATDGSEITDVAWSGSDPEGKANARLIAAAPEMLATLQRLREVFEQLSDGDWRHMDATYVDQLIESDGLLGCDKVIAKAEGKEVPNG